MMATQTDVHAPHVDDGVLTWSQEELNLVRDVTFKLGRSLDGVDSTTWNNLQLNIDTLVTGQLYLTLRYY